jgi:hypothetical protein
MTAKPLLTDGAAAQTVSAGNEALPAGPADVSKYVVEANTKKVLASQSLATPATAKFADVAKGSIEANTKTVLAGQSLATPSSSGFTNPKVAPGLVRWHGSFAAACEAARKSGKPVLLCQMMGKLDQQFC